VTTATVEVLTTPTSAAQPAAERYRYGWRYVRRDLGDGNYQMEQVPLTLEDVLHPKEGDQVTHSEAHQRRIRYLCNVFLARLADDPTAVVLDDVRIAWDLPDLKPHGPDIMVIFGVRARKNWSTFDVAEEGVRPALVIEVPSPETASLDRSNKLEEYDLAGVPLYVIVDAFTLAKQPRLRLLGYTRTPNGLQVLPPDARGWLWLEPVRLWLAVQDNELVCYDEAGTPVADYVDVVAARTQAEARAEAAETRLRELEAELRQLRNGERDE
jgi:Uma2 family endonuclease